MDDKRLTELETRYSFQEDLLQELNQTMVRQQRQLDELQRALLLLQGHVVELLEKQDPAETDPAMEKPPHY